MSEMASTALADLRVLDLSTHVAGPFCTKLFADFGADVIKVEPPGRGDEARYLGAYPNVTPDPEASCLFLYLNTNKRSITLHLDTATGRDILHQLVATADIVIESFDVGRMTQLGCAFDILETIKPGIILTSITPFGQTGPWRNYQATDVVMQAASGLSAVNRVGEGPPLREPGVQTGYQGGAMAFIATMGAVAYRDVQGVGQHVDIALQEAAATMIAPEITRVAYANRSPGMRLGFLPCKDGFVTLNVRTNESWRELWEFLGVPENADDPRFLTVKDRRVRQKEMEEYLRPHLARFTMEALFEGLQPKRILVGMALDMPRLVTNPHLQARDFFAEVDHPVAGTLCFPGAPFKMSRTPWCLRAPAPLLGQHNEEVYVGLLGHSLTDIQRWQAEGIL